MHAGELRSRTRSETPAERSRGAGERSHDAFIRSGRFDRRWEHGHPRRPRFAPALVDRAARIYDFTNEETAEVLGASFGQAKAWIQSARAKLEARYAESCALVAQKGVCHQCTELDTFFLAHEGDPLAGSARDLDARLAIVRARRETPLGPWHRAMMRLVDEVLDTRPSEPTH